MVKSKNMIFYIIKRILLMIPMLLLILTVTFILSTFISQPGAPLNNLEGLVDPLYIEAEKERMGFYDPWYIKLAKYFQNFFTGNWGISYLAAGGPGNELPVTTLIAKIFPKTIELVIIPIIIIPILSVKLGVTSAKNRNNFKDSIVRGFMMIGVCLPVFWLASLIQYFIGNTLFYFTYGALNIETMNSNSVSMSYDPITGFRLIDSILLNDQALLQDTLIHLILPSFCLIIVSLAGITRQTRASMLEVMQKDYIRTARAKGVSDKDVINKHTLRNALIPTSTAIVGTVAGLLTGVMFIELVFNYTGMGWYMWRAIFEGNYNWYFNFFNHHHTYGNISFRYSLYNYRSEDNVYLTNLEVYMKWNKIHLTLKSMKNYQKKKK